MTDIIERLRNHPSRDNRSLLDEAANEIETLRNGNAAKWVKHDRFPQYVTCSNCRDCFVMKEWLTSTKWNYCPQCGAKIEKEEHNETGS